MAELTDTRHGITLACSPEKQGDTVVFTYSVTNAGTVTAFVADAAMKIDSAARTVEADPDGVTVWRGADNYAHVLKGVAELPTDRTTPGRVMPLMHALAPGARIERVLTLALPLAEHSPYFAIGNLRHYRLSEIEGVTLSLDVLPAPPPPFEARPVPYAPDYVDVGVRGTLPLMKRLSCAFRARGLHLMLRTDSYPRPER